MIKIKSYGLHWKNYDFPYFNEFKIHEEDILILEKAQGIYVLESNFKPIYVGKAETQKEMKTSLFKRLKKHTRNHHRGQWNTFSWFEIDEIEDIKVLEMLIIMCCNPSLNRQTKTKLSQIKKQKTIKQNENTIF
ncbi:MAG: GIY-YIG nuclease family protein [Bacteroidetes bacterium]|nr:GIY-YIG nuclease family protein [Bacteroidota bacterium]